MAISSNTFQESPRPREARSSRRPLTACTIISRNYLSHARILARSFIQHEPGGRFYVLVVDRLPAGVSCASEIRLLDPDELALPYLYELCFKYDVTELCTAVKPSLLSLLLSRYTEEVIYFDPDILIMRPLDELEDALARGNIVLTPHLLKPIPGDDRRPNEQDILIAGSYNLGFLALRKSEETNEFLRWWQERLRDGCRVDIGRGLMTDQKWIDLIPGFFPSTVILRDDTYNVAYWNIPSRVIEKRADQFLVNGRPLAFFHFSGFSPDKPRVFSRHQNRTEISEGSALAALLDQYVQLHMENGYPISSRWPYGYSRFDNGLAVHPVVRQMYLDLANDKRQRFHNPFQVNGADSFLDWATRPRSREGKLSRFLERIYRSRSDLAVKFPHVHGKDQHAFLNWAKTQGAREMGYDPQLVCVDRSITAAIRESSNAGAFADREQGARIQGVNFCGYLRNESGLGAAARGYVRALRHLQVPLALRDLSGLSVNRSEDRTLTGFEADCVCDVNILCVNADQHFVVMEQLGEEFFRGRYNIGIWAWELPRFPEKWYDRFPYYDEIWVGTSFIANMLAPIAPVPVVRIPPVLSGGTLGSRDNGRRRLSVSREEFVYLFIFDFHSYFQRKNPLALIDAFKKAFAPSDAARLVIKCVNAKSDAENFAALTSAAQGYPISIHSDYWPAQEMRDLMAACDAYVSLHRSEGTGLTITDAMAMGKPVIATAWSGNMDFMNDSNSFPVRYQLVELQEDVGPYQAGETWAEPSIEHAAELLRGVFENQEEAKARGQAARQELITNFSEESLARIIKDRLDVIVERSRTCACRHDRETDRGTSKQFGYRQLVGRIQDLVRAHLPPETTVSVVSKGDDELLKLSGRQGWHFPQSEDGRFAGYYPADSATAIAQLEAQRVKGAEFLLFPGTALWWLEHYVEFKHYLESHYRVAVRQEDTCLIFALLEPIKHLSERSHDFRYPQLVHHIREIAGKVLPAEAAVLVLTKGDDEMLKLKGRKASHFPQGEGDLAGHRYLDSTAAIGHLEVLRAKGGGFLILPQTTFFWLEHCSEFRQHLDVCYQRVWRDEYCIIYQLACPEENLLKQVSRRLDYALRTLKQLRESSGEVDNRLAKVEVAAESNKLQSEGFARELEARVIRAEQAAESDEAGLAELASEVKAQAARLEKVAKNVERLGNRFLARPYMAKDVFGTAGDLGKPMGYGVEAVPSGQTAATQLWFANLFRGPEEFIAQRQAIYLPFFRGFQKVVDLGCGRGEFLRLLSQSQIPAVGVELDPRLVRRLQAQGFEAVQGDAIDYLRSLPERSLDGIFSAQVIEHLDPKQLPTLLALARSRLRGPGIFVAETVNPESFEALKTFHVDLTHQKPIYPQVLLSLCQEAGFSTARIFYPLGDGFSQEHYDTAGEYAVVAMA